MRKISTGVQGGPVLGTFTALENNLKTIPNNVDIVFDPNGTGETKVNSHLQINSAQSVKFSDADSSNYVAIKAPATVSSNLTLTLPTSVTNGHVLKTDGSGNLTFASPEVPSSNNTTSTGTYYPMLADDADAQDGAVATLIYSQGKLTYVPSTGTLTATVMNSPSFTGTNATLTGTMQAATINETSSIALKENISPIENALDAVLKLAGKMYDRKDGSSKNEIGLIAEEVNEIIPQVVSKDENGNPQAIYYSRLTAYLIEAIKDIKTQVDKLGA